MSRKAGSHCSCQGLILFLRRCNASTEVIVMRTCSQISDFILLNFFLIYLSGRGYRFPAHKLKRDNEIMYTGIVKSERPLPAPRC